MATAPPIARDRLIGLAKVPKNLVVNMEDHKRIPPKMKKNIVDLELEKISNLVMKLADKDIFPWLETKTVPDEKEAFRAATVVADRLCKYLSPTLLFGMHKKKAT